MSCPFPLFVSCRPIIYIRDKLQIKTYRRVRVKTWTVRSHGISTAVERRSQTNAFLMKAYFHDDGEMCDEGFRKGFRLKAQTSFDFLNIFVLANHHQEVRILNDKIGTGNHLETVRKQFFYRNHLNVMFTSQMEFSNRLP